MSSYSKKVILVRMNDISMSHGDIRNVRVDVNLLSDKYTLKVNEDYARFEIPKGVNSDVSLFFTYYYNINRSELQINKSSIEITPKILSKDATKNPNIEFVVDKHISRIIETNVDDVVVNSKFTIVFTTNNSTRMKTFIEEFERHKNQPPTKTVNPLMLIHGSTQRPSVKKEDGQRLSSVKKEDVIDRTSITDIEEEKPDEDVMSPDEEKRRTRLKSEIVRKSLKLNFEDFTYNTACKRCNYMERMIKAQEKDIEVLQNQVECFLRGNFNHPLDKAFELESENLLRQEPVFKRIFSDIDVSLEKAESNMSQGRRLSQSPSRRQSQSPSPKKERHHERNDTNPRQRHSSTDNRSNRLVQKPGEEVNIYMLDNDRAKRIEKYEQEIDNLRGQVFSLTKEMKTLKVIREENETLRVQIARAEKLRVEIEQKLIDNSNACQNEIASNMVKIENYIKENRHLEETSKNLMILNDNLKYENLKVISKNKEIEEALKINKVNTDVINNNNKTITTLKEEFNKFEKSRVYQQDEFKRSIGELTFRINELKNENNKVMAENIGLNQKIRDLDQTVQNKTKEIMDKQKRILDLETVNLTLKSEHLNITEIMRHRDELTNKFNRVMEINYNLNDDLSKLNKSFEEKIVVLQEKSTAFEKECNKMRDDIEKKRRELMEKDNKISNLQLNVDQLKLEVAELNSKKLYAYTSDENNKILQDTIKSIFDFNSKIIVESNDIGDYVIRQADKNMTAQHYIRKLMKALFDKEKQLKEYRKYVDINKYQDKDLLYIPIRQDQIDIKMGELINNYPNRSRLRENFVRESRGNYKYGDKKIQVLSEGAKLSIKYLNNLLSFDDFIDMYG